jgi:photosystem II stability/assembly factor-like uncharacterized protein
MKKLVVLLLSLLISFSIKSYSQSIEDWEVQQTGIPHYLWGVHFTDPFKGWIIGDVWNFITYSTVLHTENGGKDWIQQNIDNGEYYLWEIYFPDSLHGWVVGEYYYNNPYGAIFSTTNGGQDWTLQLEIDQWGLYGVYFTDSINGWVVGGGAYYSGPVILVTNDGGNTWIEQYSDTTKNFSCFDINFYNDSIGWVVGSNGSILNTIDGGNNWNLQNSFVNYYLYDVHAFSESHAYACGSMGTFLFTNDGGDNWYHLPSSTLNEQNLYGIYFLDSFKGWIVGDLNSLFYTTDGGTNWTHETFGSGDYLHDIYFTDPSNGWIVGMDGMVYHTSNGGGLITQQNEYLTDNIDSDITITPNPSQDYFDIIFNLNRNERIKIILFDFKGNKIQLDDQLFLKGQHKINSEILKNQPDGIYVLKFQSSSINKTMKIVHIN